MKVAVLLVVLVSSCKADGGADSYPVRPGGGGPIASTGGDAGTGDAGTGDGGTGTGDAGMTLSGRVCVLNDLTRMGDPAACSGSAGGLAVTLGTKSATTADNGAFQIDAPAGGGLRWRVTSRGGAIVPSVMPFGADYTIPAVTDARYLDFLNANSVVLADQQGSILVRVVRGGAPASGVSATLPLGASDNETFYDPAPGDVLSPNQTGPAGIVWLPGVNLANTPPTLVPVTLTLGTTTVSETLPVENQAITFATVELP